LSELSNKNVLYLNPSKEVYLAQVIELGIPETAMGFMAAFGEAIALVSLIQTARCCLHFSRKPT